MIFDNVWIWQNPVIIEVQTILGGDILFKIPAYKSVSTDSWGVKVGYCCILHYQHCQTSLTNLLVTLHGSRPKPLICPHEPVQNSSEVCREKEKC